MEIAPFKRRDVTENTLRKLSRDIAMDIYPLEDILDKYCIDAELWQDVSGRTAFKRMLAEEQEIWSSPLNASERVRIKSQSFVESLLPELFERAHDPNENLPAKVEIVKTVSRLAGLDKGPAETALGDKLSVTINLGADTQLKFDKPINHVIDVTPNE